MKTRHEAPSGGTNASEILKKIEELGELPTLPHVAATVLKVTEDPDSSVGDLTKVITHDQSLAAKVLKLANSAYFGLSGRVSSIDQAVIMLGFRTVRRLVLGSAVFGLFSGGGKVLSRDALWKHSIACAITAHLIAMKAKLSVPDDAFAAGLLHDIGLVVMDKCFHRQLAACLKLAEDGDKSLTESERMVFGLTHADLGRAVAERWKLPPRLTEPIGCHHLPSSAKHHPELTAAVHAADTVCWLNGFASDLPGVHARTAPSALDVLGIDEELLEEVGRELVSRKGNIEGLAGAVLPKPMAA